MELKNWIFSNLGKGAATPAKHLAIKAASNLTRAQEFATHSSTADANGYPKAAAATVSSFILRIHRHNGPYLRKTQETKTILKFPMKKILEEKLSKKTYTIKCHTILIHENSRKKRQLKKE